MFAERGFKVAYPLKGKARLMLRIKTTKAVVSYKCYYVNYRPL